MVDARSASPARRLVVWRVVVAAAAVYFVAGGVASLWFPHDGLDLYCSYVAGISAAHHESPYERATYERTWDALAPPPGLADSRAFRFAYPPAWIPACLALGRLSWPVARTLWKLLNVVFLAASVLLTFRLLDGAALDACDRAAVWCFALTLSPTLTVLTVGQTSLLVLCALLAAGTSLQEKRPRLAGLALAVAMTKPQLASAFVVFLLLRGEVVTLAVGAACSLSLAALGLVLTHTGVGTYLAALEAYTETNGPTSHIAVGIASLLAHTTRLGTPAVTAIGAVGGVAIVAGVAWTRDAHGDRIGWRDALPTVLYVAPLAFRCHAYDLVALIPAFAWSRASATAPALRRAIQGLCLVLIVPRAALRIAWERTLGSGVAPDVFRFLERGFRTWVLLLLLPPIVLALRRRLDLPPGSPAR